MHKLLILGIAALLHGCASTSSTTMLDDVTTDKVYNVVFEGSPDLSGKRVLASELEIGEVLTSSQKNGGVTVAKISIQSEYDDLMNSNTVFVASDGMLVHEALGDEGEPLNEGDKVLGFTSTTKLVWHKTKMKVQDATNYTKQMAQDLYKKAGGS